MCSITSLNVLNGRPAQALLNLISSRAKDVERPTQWQSARGERSIDAGEGGSSSSDG